MESGPDWSPPPLPGGQAGPGGQPRPGGQAGPLLPLTVESEQSLLVLETKSYYKQFKHTIIIKDTILLCRQVVSK